MLENFKLVLNAVNAGDRTAIRLECAKCKLKFCYKEITDKSTLSDFCPMRVADEIIRKTAARYRGKSARKIYIAAAQTEKEAYKWVDGKLAPTRPRVRELVEFAKKLGVKKIGISFCIGLSDEASRIVEILEHHGFTTYSVVCKCGAIDKTEFGVPAVFKIRDPSEFEAGCNPILQAKLLNLAETEINVIVGLCVGHDMLFTMESKAPVTTLVVKDRLTGHNPAASLYTSYHRRLIT